MENLSNEIFNQDKKIDEIKKMLKTMDPELVKFILFKFFIKNSDQKKEIIKCFKHEVKGITKISNMSNIVCFLLDEAYKTKEIMDEFLTSNKNYKEILKKCKKLSLELKLSNSLELANLYTYLLWNGFFSINKELFYQKNDRLSLSGMYSYDIMSGKGVCLNFSDMLTDFINEFDFNSATLINYANNDCKKYYKVNIERKSKNETLSYKIFEKLSLPLTKKMGNHAYNLISEYGKIYIYDSTNLCISKLNSKFESNIIAGEGISKIKPYFSYCANTTDKSFKALDLLHKSEIFESPYSANDFIFTWEECLEMFIKNKNLLNYFYYKIKNNIDIIYKNNKQAKLIIKEYNANRI